jgi:FMN phosphatase YigB (HAD superfamily)
VIKAILFDLDDTLLRLDSGGGFVRRYMMGFGAVLRKHYPEALPNNQEEAEARLASALRGAVGQIIDHGVPTISNRTRFITYLLECFDGPSLSAAQMTALFDEFHAEGYQQLAEMVTPIDGAMNLLEGLINDGYKVVIATNPLFPLDAVRHRMHWGRLNPDLPFSWITNMDHLHFAKPTAAYYEEILARIGVEAEEALMVGDAVDLDIIPARQVGMATFWINDGHHQPDDPTSVEADGQGALADLVRLIGQGWLADLADKSPLPLTVAHVGPRMIGDVAALMGFVEDLSPIFWDQRSDPSEWSVREIVAHLASHERLIHLPQLELIKRESNPFIAPNPTPPGPDGFDLTMEDTPLRLAERFAAARQETLAFLRSLTGETWQRPARHSIFGPTTMLEMAIFATRHDRLHLNQLCQTLGRCQIS